MSEQASPARPAASRRMRAVQEPIIPILGEWLREYPDTISLGQGVVHYPPPPEALAAARDYPAAADVHRYGPVAGEPALIDAIEAKLAVDNRINLAADQRIIVTAGSNMGFMNSLFAITDPGDEVILLAPYYFNHEMAIRMLDCTCVAVPVDRDYQPDLAAIAAAIGPRTRAIVTVSPNNPTGAVYPASTLEAINALCRRNGLWHISDEAYEYFTYGDDGHFSVASNPDARDHTISLFSLSKAYGFAAWRIGYMVIPATLAEAVTKAQDTNLICATGIAQHAAAAALTTGSAYCRGYLPSLAATRQRVLAALEELSPDCEAPAADGAFYVLLRVQTGMDSMTLARRLVSEHRVAVIPGQTFGCTSGCYLRVSYGALNGNMALTGVDRLVTGLHALVGGR